MPRPISQWPFAAATRCARALLESAARTYAGAALAPLSDMLIKGEGGPKEERRALKLFEVCRTELGDEVELLHDVHERVSPNQAVQFCKDAEKFKMFFMEDPLSPEDIAYFRQIRQQCATPIAISSAGR